MDMYMYIYLYFRKPNLYNLLLFLKVLESIVVVCCCCEIIIGVGIFILMFIFISKLVILMKMIGENATFKYHPRCSGVKLNHLCFTGDLILCSKGEFKSVYLLL